MGKDRAYYLLQRYRDDLASPEEVKELFLWLKSVEGQSTLKELMAEDWRMSAEDAGGLGMMDERPDWDRMLSAIKEATVRPRRGRMVVMGRMVAAAIVFLVLATGVVYWALKGHGSKTANVAAAPLQSPIVPGGNKAVLTLGDGSTISLDSAKDGTLAQQGNAKVVKVDAGVLAYDARNRKESAVLYNTIATPYGGQYQVVLPDGSKVWLNAASSLRFPTAFEGNERRVELAGEGYFEIAKDAAKPFVVHVAGGEDVQVLGTSFNIMAYANEDHNSTTLVSGKVRVVVPDGGGASTDLEPGRQAIVGHATQAVSVADANVEQTIAWKNGLFRFRETGIRELMRQVERWYNVQVVYETDGNDQDFTGVVSRSKSIDEFLHTLELTNTVHFRIEGRKVFVLR